jgi:uncharacterized cupin superfamily protein
MVRRNRSDRASSLPSIFLAWIVLPMGAYAVQPVALVDTSANSIGAATHDLVDSDPHRKVVAPSGARAADVELFRSADPGLVMDVADYDQIALKLTDWPVDEFVYILDGKVEITGPKGIKRIYGPADAFVIPKGFSGTWSQLSRIKKLTVSHASGIDVKTHALAIVPISASILNGMKKRMKVLEAWEPYLKVKQSNPTRYVEVPLYKSADRRFEVQAERFEPVDIDLMDWPIDEMFHVVRGHLELDAGDGTTRSFGPGATFVMPKGFTGHWHQTETLDLITADDDISGAS